MSKTIPNSDRPAHFRNKSGGLPGGKPPKHAEKKAPK